MANVQGKIVATGPQEQVAVDILAPFGPLVVAPESTEEALLPLLPGAVALLVRGDGEVGPRAITAGTDLKVIARSGVGYNNVDIEAATKRGIPVVFTPGAGARAVAEGAMAFMLALCKRLNYWDGELKGGRWASRFQPDTGDLEGGVLGIVGLGRIGQLLAQMAAPFDMRVLAFDPFVGQDVAQPLGVELVPLDQLLAQADFISLHAAATAENKGLINGDRLQQIKRGAYLVNLARGDLIESLDVLYQALQDGRLAGVGLDVFAPEPPDIGHPIFALPNCLTAPHALGLSNRAKERIFRAMAEDVAAVLRGERPENVVNPDVLG